MLSTDAYLSIKFAIFGCCFLGASFTIITTKISFRVKVHFSFLLAFFTLGLLVYLESLYNNCKLYKYIFNLIDKYFDYWTFLKKSANEHIVIELVGFLFIELFISLFSYFFITYPLKILSKKTDDISPVYLKYFILLDLIIHIIDAIILYIFISKINIMIISIPSSDISYSDISDELTFKIIILYVISGIVHYINYRYFLDYNECSTPE